MDSGTRDRQALVVYESTFGNSREIAEAIAAGLSEHMWVEVRDVTDVPAADPTGHDLVVAGGPAHAFSPSRPCTGDAAVTKGAFKGSRRTGLREWLEQLPRAVPGQLFAAFDTRVEVVRHVPGSAARKTVRKARDLGFTTVGRETFRVLGVPGPLMTGEQGRAKKWGAHLATALLSEPQQPTAS